MLSGSGSPQRKRALRVFLWSLVAMGVFSVAFYLALLPTAFSRERSVEKRWADEGMPIAGFLEGLPRTENDAAAERLCAAVAKLGFSMKPRTGGACRDVLKENADRWERAKGGIQAFVAAELEKPGSIASPPEVDTAEFLAEAQPALQEVRDLLQRETPVWIRQPQKGMAAPLPNLLSHIQLTRLLVADALRSHALGQDNLALVDLDAAWRLSESLESNPELISQLIVIAMRKMDMGALRKLDGVPQAWQRRLETWDPHKGIVTAFRAEAAAWELEAKQLEPSSQDAGSGKGGHGLLGMFLRPYMRLGTADAVGRLLSMIQEERKAGPCPPDSAVLTLGERAAKSIPWWNLPGKMMFPNLSSSWLRAKYARIQEELTCKVIQIKAARSTMDDLPNDLPGIEKSFCPKERWTYTLTSDGGISVSFSGPMPAKSILKGIRYPQEYREEAGSGENGARSNK
jgi:hypothetical protein